MSKNKLTITIILVILAIFFIVTVFYRSGSKTKANLPPGTHGVKVTEVVQTSNYTYLQVQENDQQFWIAIVSSETKPGDSLYYTKAMEMKNFKSKELNRTFASIYFVEDASPVLITSAKQQQQPLTPQKVPLKRWTEISVDVPKGGITIGELYKSPGNFTGKTVSIRGVVVRFNSQIMNKNWVHIQDGTDFSEKFDLTVTTADSVAVGKTATFSGTITLGKDFGSGYYYDVIMESAKVTDIK
jgi:biopolymer transport protein ExbD